MTTVHTNDIEMEKAMKRIMVWDYEATGDLAPWDYDENTITGSGKADVQAFIVETGWNVPAQADPQGFNAAFIDWYKTALAAMAR